MNNQSIQIIVAIVILIGSLFFAFKRRKNNGTLIAMGLIFSFDLFWLLSLLRGIVISL
jgi:LPXTG-motif cell wall-anchored protein